jgi:hypothetical protein
MPTVVASLLGLSIVHERMRPLDPIKLSSFLHVSMPRRRSSQGASHGARQIGRVFVVAHGMPKGSEAENSGGLIVSAGFNIFPDAPSHASEAADVGLASNKPRDHPTVGANLRMSGVWKLETCE